MSRRTTWMLVVSGKWMYDSVDNNNICSYKNYWFYF